VVLFVLLGVSACIADFKPQGYQFDRIPTSATAPGSLREAAVGFAPDGKLAYIFGGKKGVTQQSDFFSYDFNSTEWAKLNVSHTFSGHCYGQNLIPHWATDGETNNNDNQNIYLWTEFGNKNVLLRYNFSAVDVVFEDTTRTIHIDGACTVAPTTNNSIVNFFIFGGSISTTNCTADLWYFANDGTSLGGVWKTWNMTDQKPTERTDARLAAANSTRIYMFGGTCDSTLAEADLWLADLGKNTWEKVIPVGPHKPESRTGHSLVFDFTAPPPYQLLLFGGLNGNKTLDDVWRFDINTSMWEPLQDFNSSVPTARRKMGSSFGGGRMILFGGEDNEYQLNNELWQLVLNDDCTSAVDCEACVVGHVGCGWCSPNPTGFRCVAGASYGSYLGNDSCANITATQWSSEFATCPLDQFPGWIIALVIIGCIVLVGTIIYFVMRRNSKVAGYENIG